MAKPERKMPTGARRAQLAKRAQLVFGLMAATALLYRMLSGWLGP